MCSSPGIWRASCSQSRLIASHSSTAKNLNLLLVGMHFVPHAMGDLLSVLAPVSVLGLSTAPEAQKH